MVVDRRGSDLGLCLAKSLKIFRSTDVSFLSLISADSKSESTNEAMLESVFMSMNECIRREISKITEAVHMTFPHLVWRKQFPILIQ